MNYERAYVKIVIQYLAKLNIFIWQIFDNLSIALLALM